MQRVWERRAGIHCKDSFIFRPDGGLRGMQILLQLLGWNSLHEIIPQSEMADSFSSFPPELLPCGQLGYSALLQRNEKDGHPKMFLCIVLC